jgi:protein disulfide-isomerase
MAPQTVLNPAVPSAPPTQAPAAATAPIPGAPDLSKLPPNAPPVGFEGYCPVSMRNHWKWVAGDPRFGIVHRGRTYWFAGQEEQQQFWADPDRYTPALSGMDPVLAVDHQQQVPGKREHSLDYDNLFYLFSSEATLQQFTANPQRYATSVRQAMGIPRGRLVR